MLSGEGNSYIDITFTVISFYSKKCNVIIFTIISSYSSEIPRLQHCYGLPPLLSICSCFISTRAFFCCFQIEFDLRTCDTRSCSSVTSSNCLPPGCREQDMLSVRFACGKLSSIACCCRLILRWSRYGVEPACLFVLCILIVPPAVLSCLIICLQRFYLAFFYPREVLLLLMLAS